MLSQGLTIWQPIPTPGLLLHLVTRVCCIWALTEDFLLRKYVTSFLSPQTVDVSRDMASHQSRAPAWRSSASNRGRWTCAAADHLAVALIHFRSIKKTDNDSPFFFLPRAGICSHARARATGRFSPCCVRVCSQALKREQDSSLLSSFSLPLCDQV